MRIAILHDYFDKYGGGEKVAITLAKALGADIITGFVDEKNTYQELMELNVVKIAKKPHIPVISLMGKFEKLKLDYDFFIFSGTICISANQNKPNLWYCHTPARYLYDLKDWYDTSANVLGRVAINQLRKIVHPKDQMYAKRFDAIVANSENVRKRIKKYYGIEKVPVIYPPTDVKKFKYKNSEGFYLSLARLDKLKRVYIIVKAFRNMPDKKLVVISSGPEKKNIENLANGHDNIEVKGWVSDEEYVELLSRCIATIYVPINEDSGISPVESMAAGKPCIVSDEGGVIETVNRKTGICINPSEKNITKAVEWLTPDRARKMRVACTKRSKRFSEKKFIKEIKKQVMF